MAGLGQVADGADGVQYNFEAHLFTTPGDGCFVGGIVHPDGELS